MRSLALLLVLAACSSEAPPQPPVLGTAAPPAVVVTPTAVPVTPTPSIAAAPLGVIEPARLHTQVPRADVQRQIAAPELFLAGALSMPGPEGNVRLFVSPSTFLYAAGARTGDFLQRFSGRSAMNLGETIRVMRDAAPELATAASLVIEVQRGGVPLIITADLTGPPAAAAEIAAAQQGPPPGAATRPVVPLPATPADYASLSAEQRLDRAVREIDATTHEIDRAYLRGLIDDGEAMQSARIVPFMEEGRPVGFRLYGIRQTSLAGRLGLQNGDLVRSVNGRPLTTPEEALNVYAELSSAPTIDVEIERRGQPLQLRYRVR